MQGSRSGPWSLRQRGVFRNDPPAGTVCRVGGRQECRMLVGSGWPDHRLAAGTDRRVV